MGVASEQLVGLSHIYLYVMLPDDIKLMFEQMMTEDPDSGPVFSLKGGRDEELKAAGYNVDVLKHLNPWKNCVAFTIEKSGQLIYKNSEEHRHSWYNATHDDIRSHIIYFQAATPAAKIASIVRGPLGDLGIARDPKNKHQDLTWFLGMTDRNKLLKFIENLDWEGRESREALGVSGRMWPKALFIAFWWEKAEVLPYKDTIFSLMKKYNMDPEKSLYEFVDIKDVFTYQDLGFEGNKEKRSDAEILDLMKKQHIDPNAKKKLAAIQKVHQLKSPGFDFQAQKNAMMPAVAEEKLKEFDYDVPDGVPSMKDTLQEDPDSPYIEDKVAKQKLKQAGKNVKEFNELDYSDAEATPFTIADKFGVVFYMDGTKTHDMAIHADIRDNLDRYLDNPRKFLLKQDGDEVILESIDKFYLMTTLGTTVKEFPKLIQSVNKWVQSDSARGFPNFYSGRLWVKKAGFKQANNILFVSFWCKKEYIVKNMKLVDRFLKKFWSNPEEFIFQFTDSRDVFFHSEMDHGVGSGRSDAEIADLMKKQHLDPAAKKKLALLTKAKQVTSPGFDFQAQRNAMMPALQEIANEILKENPDHIRVPSPDIEKLRKNGFGTLVNGGTDFTDWDSTSVFFDEKQNRVLYGTTDELGGYATHKGIMKQIDLYRHFGGNFEITEGAGEFGLQATKAADRKRVMYPKGSVHGVGFKNKLDFEAYLNFAEWTKPPFYREQTNMILGRYWENASIISFWSERAEVVKNFKIVELFLNSINLKRERVAYQFVDSERIYLYSELQSNLDAHETLSPDEIAALRRRQHVDPVAKKKLAAIDQVKQVVSPGFDFQAQRNAMMPAVAEETLTEDPNRINVGPGQTTTLGAKGADVKAIKRAYFDSPGSISFIYDRLNHEMMFNQATSFYQTPLTHPDMGEQIMAYLAYPDRYEIVKGVGGMVLQPSLDDEEGPGSAAGEIIFPSITTEDSLKKYLDRIGNIMPMDGSIPRNSKTFLMGRLWTKEKVISFWGKKADVLKHLKAINDLIVSRGLKPEEILFEFLDDVHLFSYDELQGGNVQTRSSAEQQALMAQQHFKKDDAARKNWQMKKDSGFDFQAQKAASLPALEESPDTVHDRDGEYVVGWDTDGAYAFISTHGYSIIGKNKTHYGIIKLLYEIFQGEDPADTMARCKSKGIYVSNEEAVIQDILDADGFLGEFFIDHEREKDGGEPNPNIRYAVDEGNDNFILGRVWPEGKILSFWNEQHAVLKLWSWTQKMFQDHRRILGKIEKYKVDFIERDGESEESGTYPDFTPAKDIERSKSPEKPTPTVDKNGQLNMIAQLFNKVQELPRLPEDRLKQIREKLHVLDPNVKAQVAKMLNQAGQHKAAAIAAKLGMSTAEFNYLWNVNEGNIKLSDLIQ